MDIMTRHPAQDIEELKAAGCFGEHGRDRPAVNQIEAERGRSRSVRRVG